MKASSPGEIHGPFTASVNTYMLIHVICSMAGLLATSGCVDLSGPMFADAARVTDAPPLPLPAVADKLAGTWVEVAPSPQHETREFRFFARRYDGTWASKAASMFGFAAPWELADNGYLSGSGFWGASPDRAGEFVVYAHMSGIVFQRAGTIRVDGDTATFVLESQTTMALRRTSTSTDVSKPKPKEAAEANP